MLNAEYTNRSPVRITEWDKPFVPRPHTLLFLTKTHNHEGHPSTSLRAGSGSQRESPRAELRAFVV